MTNMTNSILLYASELKYLCKEGDVDKVYELLKNGSKYTNDLYDNNKPNFSIYNWGLEGACESGNIELVELMISKGANFFNYSYATCKGSSKNKRKILNILISHGANNFYDGLCGACEGSDDSLEDAKRRIELVKFMILKNIEASPTRITQNGLQDWIYVIYSACKHGHPDIADLLVTYSIVPRNQLPKEYFEYKQAQVLKFTNLHECLVLFILKKSGTL